MKRFSFLKFLDNFFGYLLTPICLVIAVIVALGSKETEITIWKVVFTKEDLF